MIKVRHESAGEGNGALRHAQARAPWAALVSLSLLVTACAASPPPPSPSPAAADRAFASIQVHEAALAHAALLAADSHSAETQQAAAREASQAAAAICGEARALRDADAEARCRRAERTSAALH